MLRLQEHNSECRRFPALRVMERPLPCNGCASVASSHLEVVE